MSTTDPLIALPDGTYPLTFAPSARSALRGGKRARDDDELLALRYQFKPASVTADMPGSLEQAPGVAGSSSRVLVFDGIAAPNADDGQGTSSQVFDVSETASKTRECVLIWNDAEQAFKLHALPTTLGLVQNRILSSQRVNGAFPSSEPKEPPRKRARPAAAAAPEPKAKEPKAKAKAPAPSAPARKQPSMDEPVLPSSVTAPAKKAAAAKKKKAPAKKTAAAAAKPKATPKKKGGKAAAAAASPVASSKIKSVEIIEDSDDDDDGMDEFANLLGEAVEQADNDYDDDDEEEEVEDDEDDELGGAHFAGYQAVPEPEVEYI